MVSAMIMVAMANLFMRSVIFLEASVAHILPWPRLMVWRITGAVTLSDIWIFQISLSPCAVKSANSFGMTDTDDTVPILRHDRVDGLDHRARIELPGRDVERHGVRRLGRDAMRELF